MAFACREHTVPSQCPCRPAPDGAPLGAETSLRDVSGQDKQKKTHGKLEKNTTWSGKVLIDGDVEVPKGIVLTILPGTVIRVMEGDFTKSGFNSTMAEIHVIPSAAPVRGIRAIVHSVYEERTASDVIQKPIKST